MIAQSQTSTLSQSQNRINSTSASQFLTQQPALTQFTYKVPTLQKSHNPTPDLEVEDNELPEISDLLFRNNRPPPSSQFQRRTSKSPPRDAVTHERLPSDRDTNSTNYLDPTVLIQDREDSMTRRPLPPSTADYIDCQPLRTPQEIIPTPQPRVSVNVEASIAHNQNTAEPLTLTEHIRAVRADAGRTGMRLCAKWARSIPKYQRLILDTEDAWNPPIAGRPHRKGTIPIDLLTTLTIRADKAAGDTMPKEQNRAQETETNEHTKSPSTSFPRSAAKPSSAHSDASSETEVVYEWPSSPPQIRHRGLPPDSSPVRQAEGAIPRISPENNEQEAVMHESPQQVKQNRVANIEGNKDRSSQLESMPLQVERHTIAKETSAVRCISTEPRQISNGENQSVRDNTILPPRTTRIPSAKIQVRDKPYLSKSDQPIRKPADLPPNVPSSSFVLATFPDTTMNERKRPRAVETDRSSRQPDYVDPDYRDFDQKRQRQQRDWKQEHKKKKIVEDGEYGPQGDGDQSSPGHGQRSNSTPSSQYINTRNASRDKRSSVSISNSESHRQARMINHEKSMDSERYTEAIRRGNPASVDSFTKFKSSYPAYPGSSEGFYRALKILIRDRAGGRGLHRAMWDDFIYRFATDYKIYLQACIENYEDAQPYDDFYHQQGELPMCLKKCITIDDLHHHLNSSDLHSRPLSRTQPYSKMDIDQFEIATISPEPDGAISHPADNSRSTGSPAAPSIAETPAVERREGIQSGRAQIQSSTYRPAMTEKRVKAPEFAKPYPVRRSLPWNSSNQSKSRVMVNTSQRIPSLTAQNVQNQRGSSEASSEVGNWQGRPRGVKSPELLPDSDNIPMRDVLPEANTNKPIARSNHRLSRANEASQGRTPNSTRTADAEMRLPEYVETPRTTVMRSIEPSDQGSTGSPANGIRMSQSEKALRKQLRRSGLPVTLFETFRKNYGSLQKEERAEGLRKASRPQGISLHSW